MEERVKVPELVGKNCEADFVVVKETPDEVTFWQIVVKGRSPLIHLGDGVPLFFCLGDGNGVGGMRVKFLFAARGNHLC